MVRGRLGRTTHQDSTDKRRRVTTFGKAIVSRHLRLVWIATRLAMCDVASACMFDLLCDQTSDVDRSEGLLVSSVVHLLHSFRV